MKSSPFVDVVFLKQSKINVNICCNRKREMIWCLLVVVQYLSVKKYSTNIKKYFILWLIQNPAIPFKN